MRLPPQFLLAGLLTLACGGASMPGGAAPAATPAAATPATAPAVVPPVTPAAPSLYMPDRALMMSSTPGFQAVGHGDGVTPAPIYVTISLNINDFMRVEREAQAIRRFLADTRAAGVDPVELSFTGEVLDALMRTVPALAAEVIARKPTINEHYRLLENKHILFTIRELFNTIPATLELDRTRPGSLVGIQKAFGVTPRDKGGVAAEMLRARWTPGPQTAALAALGVEKVEKNDLVVHPDRIVAAAIDDRPTDGHEHIEAYKDIFRMMDRVAAGQKVTTNEVVERLTELARWANYAKLQGIDSGRIPGMSESIDTSRLGAFMLAPASVGPTDAELARVGQLVLTDPAGVTTRINDVFSRLYATTGPWRAPGDEVRGRLAMLDPNTVYTGRLSWHASNDYTVESWSQHMSGKGGQLPLPLIPAATRPESDQARIAAGYDAILAAFKSNPRVKFVSYDNDTQWLPANSPAVGYPAVFGVDFTSVPNSLDADKIDAMARAQGLKPPDASTNERSVKRPGQGQQRPAGGGPPGGRAPGGQRKTSQHGR